MQASPFSHRSIAFSSRKTPVGDYLFFLCSFTLVARPTGCRRLGKTWICGDLVFPLSNTFSSFLCSFHFFRDLALLWSHPPTFPRGKCPTPLFSPIRQLFIKDFPARMVALSNEGLFPSEGPPRLTPVRVGVPFPYRMRDALFPPPCIPQWSPDISLSQHHQQPKKSSPFFSFHRECLFSDPTRLFL